MEELLRSALTLNTDNFSTVKVSSSGGGGEQSQSGGQEEARKW